MEEVRRKLRNNPTREELLLWKKLRARQVEGHKFRRQYSIGRYVVDFFCVECNLAIELDGAPHFEPINQDYEAQRTAFLQGLGLEILRFENRIVRRNIEAVLATICEAIQRKTGADLPRRADD
jgi:very-short-patch-repair endonuclease